MWHEFIVNGHWCQAKVYQGGSVYGINNSCVSKLIICKGKIWDSENVIYDYDRGSCFDNAPKGLVKKVVAYCENNFQGKE